MASPTSTEALLSNLTHLNDCAVGLLCGKGQAKNASRVLKIALRDLKNGLASTKPQEPFAPQGPAPEATEIMTIPLQDGHTGLLDDSASSPDNAFSVYRSAFVLPLSSSCAISSDDLATVLLFNLAMTLQIQGIVQGKNLFLRKALKTYQSVANMLETSPHVGVVLEQRQNIANVGWKVFAMALFNNMGHICSHFLLQDEASECINRLRYLVGSLTTSTYGHDHEDHGDLAIFHQTLLHVEILSAVGGKLAAAA